MSMQIFFCIFVTLIAVSNGWKSDSEYTFEVNGRTLTGLKDVGSQYSGIIMKAYFIVYPQTNGNLMAKIKNFKYSQIHKSLTNWFSEIPDSKLQYLDLNISSEAFEIVTDGGVITDIIMANNIENWEANIIKSIVSQLQLDTQGKNVIKDQINQLPEEGSNSGVFKTMEETITGAYETLYDISELPEYILQSQPWLVSIPEQKSKVIEIIKSKNFSNADESLVYYWGFGEIGQMKPNSNQMGDFFTKSSISRAVITGNLKTYTLQSSSTTNEIIISPTLNSKQNGIVVSYVNVTLTNIKLTRENFHNHKGHQEIGSLTYTFNKPFSSEEYNTLERSVNKLRDEDKSTLSEPPQSPLLPLFIGNKGKNIKSSDKVDIIKMCKKITQEIANEIQNPENIPKNQTLGKYVVLSTITRLMSEQEMEIVTNSLYSENAKTLQHLSWTIYRDAIAECGTGPALLTITKWIKNKKITSEEASEVVASMSQAVRRPTEDYMRTFYVLALKDKDVTKQSILNDTTLLSYTHLVRKVYVDKTVSHNQFPVHTFGNFRTEHGKRFVSEELIPHLEYKLNKAFDSDERHRVLVYIRALGNIGHQNILSVFEPYLEGEKPASKFQRLQMVIALDKLVKTYSKVASSVLYKIYQNTGEEPEIRVAAVYQLIRTNPPRSMLQRMAKYTNIDTNQQVNSAVKTAIITAARLKGKEFYDLSRNARAAEYFLTKKIYGQQYSGDYLRSYVEDKMDLFYKQTVQVYGSEDSIIPKGIKYAFRTGFGGMRRQLMIVQVMISSVDDLVNIFERQTQDYERAQEEYGKYSEEAKLNKFSSEAIAKMLGLEFIKREELEGSLFLQILGSAARYFTFDNSTIGTLPSVLREVEELLSEGYNLNFNKLINRYELAISFPTEMAFPFIYTMDMPTLLSCKGQIRATAEPKMSAESKLVTPQTITAHAQLQLVISLKMQAKLGFTTPFDHQQYISGFDRNLQINLPTKTQLEFDLKSSEIHAQFQPLTNENTQIFHYSSLPFTMIKDIIPHNSTSDIKLMCSREPATQFKYAIGEQNGMVFNVELISEQKYSDFYWIKQQFLRNDSLGILLTSFYDQNLECAQLNIDYDADRSTTNKIQFRSSTSKKFNTDNDIEVKIDDFTKLSRNFKDRQSQLAKMAGFKGTNVEIYEFSIQFDGKNKVAYTASLARSDRSKDNKSKLVFYMKKVSSNGNISRPLEIALWAKTFAPRTNRLNFLKALNSNADSKFEAKVFVGENLENPIRINIEAKFDHSEARIKYLKQHPRAKKCFSEMQAGNNALPNCANMTLEANLLNHMKLNIRYDKNISLIFNYNLGSDIDIETFIDDKLEAINMTLECNGLVYTKEDIHFKALDKPIFVIHPDYSVWSRIMGNLLKVDGFGDSCVIDSNAVNTFDNKTYPLQIDTDKWVVLFHYTPRYVSGLNKIEDINNKNQFEQYSVLIRKNGYKARDVKVILRNTLSGGKLVEVDMRHDDNCSSSNCLGVYINGNKITDSTNIGWINVYNLPVDEIKVKIKPSFSIIYDGFRVLIEEIEDKFRGSVRGLCGSFSQDVSDDFLTPKNCIVKDPKDFLASYTLENRGKEVHDCLYKNTVFANVISDVDAGHLRIESNTTKNDDDSCVKYQTGFVIEGDEVCFTINSLPACKKYCSADKMINQDILVHCVRKSAVSDIWKKQIEKGGNLDFSHKDPTKSLKMKVPQVCTKY